MADGPLGEKSELVVCSPEDIQTFKRKYNAIRLIVHELEDENNLIAFKIAQIRRKIRLRAEEKARIEREVQAKMAGADRDTVEGAKTNGHAYPQENGTRNGDNRAEYPPSSPPATYDDFYDSEGRRRADEHVNYRRAEGVNRPQAPEEEEEEDIEMEDEEEEERIESTQGAEGEDEDDEGEEEMDDY